MKEHQLQEPNGDLSKALLLWRHLPVALTCLVGALLSVFVYSSILDWEHERIWLVFERQSAIIATSLQKGIDENIAVLRSIQGLYNASKEVDRQGFRAFVANALNQHPGVQALEWIPHVRDAERGAYEAAARRDGFTDFQITEKDKKGILKTAGQRKEYFPVFYVEPYQENAAALGFDLASEPTRLDAMKRARDSDEITTTGQIQLVQTGQIQLVQKDGPNKDGFLIFLPVYREEASFLTVEDRRKNLLGFALGVFHVRTLFEVLLADIYAPDIDFHIPDTQTKTSRRFLYHHIHWSASANPAVGSHNHKLENILAGLHWETSLSIAGEHWTVLFHPTRDFYLSRHTWYSWGALAAGLLLTTSLAAYLLVTLGRAAQVQRLVAKRTAELSQANEELQTEVAEHERTEKAREIFASKNARALKKIQLHLERQEALGRVTRNLTQNLNPATLFTELCESVCQLLDVEFTRLLVLEEQAEKFAGAGVFGKFEDMEGYAMVIPKGKGIVSRVVESKDAVSVREVLKDPSWLDREWAEKLGVKSYLGIPLLLEGQVIGVLNIFGTQIREFQSDEIELLRVFADQAVVALENARLYQEIRNRATSLEALDEIAKAINSTLNLGDLFKITVNQVKRALPCERASLRIFEPDKLHISDCFSVDDDKEREHNFDPSQTIAGAFYEEILHLKEPRYTPDTLKSPHPRHRTVASHGLRSVINVPLLNQGEMIGFLNVASSKVDAYLPEHIRFMRSVGDHLVLAMRNAELFATVKESSEYLQNLIHNAIDAVISTDLKGRITTWNPAAQTLYGYSENEVLGKPIQSIFPEGILWEELQEREHHGTFEQRYPGKDGITRDISVSLFFIRNNAGQQVGITGIHRDITERKRAELELERFRTILDQTGEALYITDVETGRFVDVNETAFQMLGYSREELLQLGPEDIVEDFSRYAPDGWAGHTRNLKGLNDVLNINQNAHRRKDGSLVPVESSVSCRTFGGREYLVAIVRDATERKRAEEALQIAKEEAEQANQAKSDFLATMSHEIRTPMNGIIGMTGLLLDTPLTDEQREYTETVRNSGDVLLSLINDILDFSKIEAGKLELEIIDFDLRITLEDVTELFANNAQSKGLWVVSLMPPDFAPVLRGDPGRLRQIFMNLIDNAIKFTEKGGITLRAAVESETDKSVLVRFEVSDTGLGIPHEARLHLFQAFSQADKSTTRKYGGTGLGLAICKQLAQLMGGEIGFESEIGKGSTFWFTANFDNVPLDARSLSTPRNDLHGLRVLLVDDEDAIREMLQEQLASWGITSEQAQNGRQALAILRDSHEKGMPYDLAILDLTMPDIDGMELAHTIKADPSTASIRLVMLTGYGQRGEGAEARKAGLSAYLVKPVTHSQLFDCISRVMGASEDTPLITRHSLQELRISERAQFRILIAEDNDVNQKVAKGMLERFGYRADAAGNGREAVDLSGSTPYDLILMDCSMPEMDGFQATAEIRRREEESENARRMPIIALTAHAMQGFREKCLEAGMDDYLSKPFKQEDLKAVIEQWLNGRSSNPSPEKPRPSSEESSKEDTEIVSLDEGTIQALRVTMGEDLGNIFDLFCRQTQERIETMRVAVTQQDADTLHRVAHSLKGSAGLIGAVRMTALSEELQSLGDSGKVEGADGLLDRLAAEFETVQPLLQEAPEKTPSSHS